MAGMYLFARLTKELVSLYLNPNIWHPEYASRYFERENENINKKVKTLLTQNFVGEVELPAMISPQDQHKVFLDVPLSLDSIAKRKANWQKISSSR